MAWNDDAGFAHTDLMGVHGDVLFADPLNVRGASKDQPKAGGAGYGGRSVPAQPTPPPKPAHSQALYDRGTAPDSPQHTSTERELHVDDDQGGNWLGNLMWSMIAGGKQCCSMRDRTVGAEAAKRAAAVGRPPPAEEPPRRSAGFTNKFPDADAGASSEEETPRHPVSNSQLVDGPLKPRTASPEAPEDRKRSAGAAQAPRGGGLNLPMVDSPQQPPERPGNRSAPPPAASEPPAPLAQPMPTSQPASRAPTGDEAPPMATATPAAVKARMPAKWEWPPWCLNFKAPCIEVWVVDEDTGEGKWCEAEPQVRVVDGTGGDAYLSAEYAWDGDYYVQDFGPHHVRRRGQKITVFQLFDKQAQTTNGVMDRSTSMAMARGASTVDDLPPEGSKTRPRRDSGAGVADWLDDSI